MTPANNTLPAQGFFEKHREKIDLNGAGGCWVWAASTSVKGYGLVWAGGKYRRAHREAYESVHGPVPDGMIVRHKCDNPPCTNPAHLELGTNADNTRDMMERGRNGCGRLKGSAHGCAKLTEADVLSIRSEYVRGSSEFGQIALGRRFGVERSMISQIIRRKAWDHIA